MSDYSAFAPKPVDLSGLAAMLGPVPMESGVVAQSAPRRISMLPMMFAEQRQRDEALQAAFGSTDQSNALKQLMMTLALQQDQSHDASDLAGKIGPSLINHGMSTQAQNLGPINDQTLDPSAWFAQSMPHDANSELETIAKTALGNANAKAAPVNANANMLSAQARMKAAGAVGGNKYKVQNLAPNVNILTGTTGNPNDLAGMMDLFSQGRGAQGQTSDVATQDYANTSSGATAFVAQLAQHGETVVQHVQLPDGRDFVVTDGGNQYFVDPTTGTAFDADNTMDPAVQQAMELINQE